MLHHWHATLLVDKHSTRHCLCSQSSCPIQQSAKAISCHGSEKDSAIPHLYPYTYHVGTHVTTTTDFTLDCFLDADFAGLYHCDPPKEQTSSLSPTGYIIKLCGMSLIWKSTLQTSIALSTGESEYAALSASMRILIPV